MYVFFIKRGNPLKSGFISSRSETELVTPTLVLIVFKKKTMINVESFLAFDLIRNLE
jgi:hypothetical protein